MDETPLDDELVNIYVEEATDLLQALAANLALWKESPEKFDIIKDLQRDLHTFKGGARMVQQGAISALAHELESYYQSLQENKIIANDNTFKLANEIHDHLAEMIDLLNARKEIIHPQDKIDKIKKFIESPNFEERPDKIESHNENKGAQNLSDAIFKSTSQLRVSSETMEKLNFLAEDNNITRVHITDYSRLINEQIRFMQIKLFTLGQYLKELEIANDISLNKTDDKNSIDDNEYKQFDALEFDKYSETHQRIMLMRDSVNELNNAIKKLLDKAPLIDDLLSNQARVSNELQSSIMSTRLIGFDSIIPRLERIARSVSTELDKKVNFQFLHDGGEMDKNVLEKILKILEHMIRNAIDHGMESSAYRIKNGKSEIGNLIISAYRKGTYLEIIVSDDGKGIDKEAIRQKAINQKRIADTDELTEANIYQLILEPGFSTKESLTQISGRGVGMDVVNAEVKLLGGTLEIQSEKHAGTKFIIRIPYSLALNKAMIFKILDISYGITLSSIDGVTRIDIEALTRFKVGELNEIVYAGKTYPLYYLGSLLHINKEPRIRVKKHLPVLLLRGTAFNYGVIVDEVIGRREIVIKGLAEQFKSISYCTGASVAADGRIVIIIDATSIANIIKSHSVKGALEEQVSDTTENSFVKDNRKVVMVVDDSLTVRKVTKNFLERNNYQVIAAKDGVDAIHLLESITPDIFLLDVEMPRMNGFELSEYIRTQEQTKNVPIIMITSRTGEKYIELAEKNRINHFLGKPYQENELLVSIEKLLQDNQLILMDKKDG